MSEIVSTGSILTARSKAGPAASIGRLKEAPPANATFGL
jgi:hypothetical protein